MQSHYSESYMYIRKMLTTIGNNYMKRSSATSINLSELVNVTSIGNCFIIGSFKLTSLDFSSLINVKMIGNWFLYGCIV